MKPASLGGDMDLPPPNPTQLLEHWMEWERGETTPGDLMKQLKMGGMRQILEGIVDTGSWGTETSDETIGDLLEG